METKKKKATTTSKKQKESAVGKKAPLKQVKKSKEDSKKKKITKTSKKARAESTVSKKPLKSTAKPKKPTKKEKGEQDSQSDKKKTTSSPKTLPLKIDSYIFYPNEGLGQITGIENRKFENVSTPYYIVTFISQKMISRIPVKNIKLLRIRKIFSKDTAQKVLKTLETADILSELTWKDRLLRHQEVIKKGNALETAEMLSSLHVRGVDRALSFQERQYYDFALESLTDELSIVLKQDVKEVLKLVKKILNNTTKSKDTP